MFETRKTLIVVYKDELLMNQLKKLVETHDDSENGTIGTTDDSINIVSWTEKVWLGNKKAGNIQGKILFLDEVKGTDKLIPVVDVKLNEYGVRFGWAGNQAVVYADVKALADRKEYDTFLDRLSALPVPDFLKTTKEKLADGIDCDMEANSSAMDSETNTEEEAKGKHRTHGLLQAAKKAIDSGKAAIDKTANQVATRSEELFRNKALMKRQMLFYGVVTLYNDWLEQFMNM